MALSHYLAMTAAELDTAQHLPEHTAYMACHFSAYGTGLSNRPTSLPPDSMLIINDRTPICAHDPGLIAEQVRELVQEFACSCVLLDFEREGNAQTARLCTQLTKLPVPVGISHHYAQALDCPVFLPSAPPYMSLEEYLRPWHGRELWLETALDACRITVTEQGSTVTALPWDTPPEGCFSEATLHCCYRAQTAPDEISFTLYRTASHIRALLTQAEGFGITRAVGLYQQLGTA